MRKGWVIPLAVVVMSLWLASQALSVEVKASLAKEVEGTSIRTVEGGPVYVRVEFGEPMDIVKPLSVSIIPKFGFPIPVKGTWKSNTLWVGTATVTEGTGNGTAVLRIGEAYTKDGKRVPAKENILEFVIFSRQTVAPKWFPNPFSPNMDKKYEKVVFSFQSWKAQQVRLEIYNTMGKLVRTITKDVKVGANTIEWDGKDDNGNPVPTGLYIGQILIPEKEAGKVVMKRYVVPVAVSR